MNKFSLFSVLCLSSLVAQAGGTGRIDPHAEMRTEPSKQIERMLKMSTGVQREHSSLLSRIRTSGSGLQNAEVEALRQKIHQEAPEMAAHIENLLLVVLKAPLNADAKVQQKKNAAVDVLKTRLREPLVIEEDSNLTLPEVETVVNSIEKLRTGLGMPSGGGLHLARHMMPGDLAEYLLRTHADVVKRAEVLEASDPAEAQFIRDILAVHPYLDLRGLHLEEAESAE